MYNISQHINSDLKENILWALSDHRAYTAVELANYAGVAKVDIYKSLEELTKAEIVISEIHRHHYYRISQQDLVKEILECLKPKYKSIPKIYDQNKLTELKYCRSCHNHLAGKIGVEIAENLQRQNILYKLEKSDKYEFELTPKGEMFFDNMGLDLNELRQKGGILAKACLDFSERIHHLGGKLGVALLEKMKEKEWIKRQPDTRIHQLTPLGKESLRRIGLLQNV